MDEHEDEFEVVDAPSQPPPMTQPEGKYGKGYLQDDPANHTGLTVQHLLGARTGLAYEASIEDFVLQVRDQASVQACVAFALARASHARSWKMLRDANPNSMPPPEVGVLLPYAVGREEAAGDPDAPLIDMGSYPSLVMFGAQKVGLISEDAWPFDPARINEKPKLEKLELAVSHDLQGWYRVASFGGTRIADIKQALSEGYPVIIPTQVDQAFEDYAGATRSDGTPIPVTAPTGTLFGGHMLCIVGYRGNMFRVVNSWGIGWGDRGFCWVDEDWIEAAFPDIFAITSHPR